MYSEVIELVTLLSPNGVYTSGTRDMNHVQKDFGVAMSNFVVTVDSDQSGSVEIDQSTDQIVWAPAATATAYTGGEGVLTLSIQPEQQFVRAKFTNSAVTQTRFAVTTGVDYT